MGRSLLYGPSGKKLRKSGPDREPGSLFDPLEIDGDDIDDILDRYIQRESAKAPAEPQEQSYDDWWLKNLQNYHLGKYSKRSDTSSISIVRTPKTSQQHPIRVDWYYKSEAPYPAKLGMSIAPGKKQINGLTADHDRDLALDLETLRAKHEIDHMVCLVERKELIELKIPNLLTEAANFGISSTWWPFPDMTAPKQPRDAHGLVLSIEAELQQGKNVLIHCKGGLGRTGCIGACFLVWCGWSPQQAINITRAARTGSIQTKTQEDFIYRYWFYVDKTFPKKKKFGATPKK